MNGTFIVIVVHQSTSVLYSPPLHAPELFSGDWLRDGVRHEGHVLDLARGDHGLQGQRGHVQEVTDQLHSRGLNSVVLVAGRQLWMGVPKSLPLGCVIPNSHNLGSGDKPL